MWNRLARGLLLAVLLGNVGTATEFYWSVNGHNYAAIDTPLTWAEAWEEAAARGGYLATITNQEEQDFLNSLFGGVRRFIGLTDEVREGTFVWATGEPFVFNNFRLFEPNNFDNWGEGVGEDIVEMGADGFWNDVPEFARAFGGLYRLGAIIEWDPDDDDDLSVVPEPGTASLALAGIAVAGIVHRLRRG
jgi:hypothetical protein